MKLHRYVSITALLLFSLLPPAWAASIEELFKESNHLYRQAAEREGEKRTEAYREAARRYAEAAAEADNTYVLYDLGNALFRAGEFGRAIAAYRRAEILMPRHAGVRRNLAIARDNAPGGSRAPKPHPAAAAFWHYGLSLAEVEALAAFFFVACMAALGVKLFVDRGMAQRIRPLPVVFGVLAFAFAASSFAKLASTEPDGAVIVVREASVRSEPAGRAVEVHVFREGAEVRVLRRAGEWTRIESEGDTRGWVETRALEFLSDPPGTPD